MRPHTNETDPQRRTIRKKRELIQALALLYLASLSVCGCSAAIAAADHFQKTIPDPPSVVFTGDSITAIWGSGQQGLEFAEHPNWVDKGISGQNSNQLLARFQTDVIDLHPEIVHILIGTNDVYPGWTLQPSGPDTINSPANLEAMVNIQGNPSG
jgi:lysophospholipase L1-like esterase